MRRLAVSPVVRRKPWFLGLARRYVRRRLRSAFDGIHLEGLAAARATLEREPLIVASTHVAWWDALVAIEIDRLLGGETYALMDAENLRRMPFFGWVGAIPLDRRSPKQGLRDLSAAATLLDRPGRVLWIFPQGRQRPAHLRPLELSPGVAWLAERSGARILPLALNYLFREAPVPALCASFGEPIEGDEVLATLEARLSAGLARIDAFVDRQEGAFVSVTEIAKDRGVPLMGRLLTRA